MTSRTERHRVSLYADRSLPTCWVVRDRAGAFWLVPVGDRAWERREPYTFAEGAQLVSVPGHYTYCWGLTAEWRMPRWSVSQERQEC